MKNVFLVPTDKESNLYRNLLTDKLSVISDKPLMNVSEYNRDNKFIYITSTEKIKDGEYGLCVGLVNEGYKSEQAVFRMDDEQREAMVDLGGQEKAQVLKVCLTNDPILIADGVQEISSSFLCSFAENPVDYAEVIKIHYEMDSKANNQTGNYDFKCPNCNNEEYNLMFSKHPTKCFNCGYYSVSFPQKEHQILTDLKDYFKNTSPEKIQSDWDETKEDSPKGLEDKDILKEMEYLGLIKEFEILEGITPEQFDEKDWARFERFCRAKVEENSKHPLINNCRWYSENGTVYNMEDDSYRIVLFHDSGSYSNLPPNVSERIADYLNSGQEEKLYTEEDIREAYMAGYKFKVEVDEVGEDNAVLPNKEQYVQNLKEIRYENRTNSRI